ncbi:hypothetical protein GW15_0214710 [Xanthomonas axonopodis pv. vasculorum]|uniref:Uncharacterized protein n=1 Tax=Xanthomonas axonopodis pv. vasculorum TaxID=325777 RepID=A0A098PXW2_9XANT|nr:hypothetical protein GW15_0214710 [Xanthomonas axonopodis pv. vasculorum]
MQQCRKPVFVEAFIAQAAVKRFDIGVLIWLARLDQPSLHATRMRPGHHRLAAKFLLISTIFQHSRSQ